MKKENKLIIILLVVIILLLVYMLFVKSCPVNLDLTITQGEGGLFI